MRELAVQASNALTDSDREDLNQEYQQKMAELDRIVDTAEFNGLKLLDGSLGTATFQVGANTTAANKIQVSLSQSLHTSHIGMTNEFGGTLKLKNGHSGDVAIADGSLAVNGHRLNVTPYVTKALNQNMRHPNSTLGAYVIEKGHSQNSAYAIAQAINNSNLGVVAHAKTEYTAAHTALAVSKKVTFTAHPTKATGTYTFVARAYGYYTLRINNFTVFSNYKVTATASKAGVQLAKGAKTYLTVKLNIGASTIAAAINKMSKTLGVTAKITEGGKLKLNNLDGGNIKISERAGVTAHAQNTLAVTHHAGITNHMALTKTFVNLFDGAKGFFVNKTLHKGKHLIAKDGFTGGTSDAFTEHGYALTIHLAGGTTPINARTVIRGTVTVTAPSKFRISDYWEAGEAHNAGQTFHFSKVRTSGGQLVAEGKTDFTRNKDVFKSIHMTTVNGKRTDGIQYRFSAAEQQMFLKTTNILTVDNAQKAIDRIDKAISDLNKFRAKLGATQNRFESTINNLNNYVQKLVDANSRIVDADVAKEAAELTQNNIKRQAAAAMLAQANQNPAIALQLLGGM